MLKYANRLMEVDKYVYNNMELNEEEKIKLEKEINEVNEFIMRKRKSISERTLKNYHKKRNAIKNAEQAVQ